MAVTQNTLIGKSRGSVGGTTFTKWKGLNILKSKAQNNYTNPTPTQVNNNSKFAVMQSFMRSIATFIVAGFKAMAVNMTEFNAFSQSNKYSETIAGTAPNFYVDPSQIVIAKGPELAGSLANVTKTVNSPTQVNLEWAIDGSVPAGNLMYAAAFLKTTGELVASSVAVETFINQFLTLEAPSLGTNIALHDFHIFMVNPATGKACDSILVTASI